MVDNNTNTSIETVNTDNTFRVFKAELPNGDVKEKRFRGEDPIAVIACAYVDAIEIYQWTTKESRIKGIISRAAKDGKKAHGDDFKEVVVVAPVLVREEGTSKPKAAKEEPKAEQKVDAAPSAATKQKATKKKVATKKKAPVKAAASKNVEPKARKFKTKASALIAARAQGKDEGSVEKSGSSWVINA